MRKKNQIEVGRAAGGYSGVLFCPEAQGGRTEEKVCVCARERERESRGWVSLRRAWWLVIAELAKLVWFLSSDDP